MANRTKTALRIPVKDRWASLFSDANGIYPTQTKNALDLTVGGEYRGFYHTGANKYWRPNSSKFLGRRNSAGKATHTGVDIYAPYYYFPLEQAIRSPVAGRLSFRYDALFPEALGNRAFVDAVISGKKIILIFGHFTRFHGRPRQVSKGE